MIYANIKDALRYRGISSHLDLALEHLTTAFLSTIGDDPVELDGRNVYCFKVNLETLPEEMAFFENHHKYIDIHLVLSGAEKMDIALPEDLEQYDEKPDADAYFFHGKGRQQIILKPGEFLVAFPEDAHKPQQMVDAPAQITKVVFKVRVE